MTNPFRPQLSSLDDRLVPTVDLTPAVSYSLKNDWGSGFQAEIALTNDQSTTVQDWRLSFDFGRQIGDVWNAVVVARDGTRVTLGPASYNSSLAVGSVVPIGFLGSGGNSSITPSGYEFRWVDPSAPPTVPPVSPPTSSSPLTARMTVENRWNGGYVANVTLTNTGSSTIRDWQVTFSPGGRVGNLWNGLIRSQMNGQVTVQSASYNAQIAPGRSVSFGFQADGTPAANPNIVVNGMPTSPPVLPPVSPPPVSPPPVVTPPSLNATNAAVTAPTATVQSSTALSTRGNQIVDASGQTVRLTGVNWFGLETPNFAPHGLWTRGYREMMDQMKQLGFNMIRLPFSQQLLDSGSRPNGVDFSKNPDLVGLNGLQVMDKIVEYAGQIGLRILLDHHRSDAGSGANGGGLWYTASRPESAWISTWQTLASRYRNSPAIIGADLHNEPHGPATWGTGGVNDWRLAAERAGNAILAVNPNWLIVVEGVESGPSGNYWWGGNLSAAGANPVQLNVANRLVYSPHDYPASVYPQSYFSASNYPNNLPAIWDANWGYLYKQNIAPILLGEFGTKYETPSDRAWLGALANYLGNAAPAGQNQGPSWAFWSWNPNSGDTGGILADDWRTPQTAKLNVLAPMQFPLLGTATGPATTTLTFTVRLSAASTTTIQVRYATQDGTATAGSDYVAASGTLLFAPGETEKTITITVLANTVSETEETFALILSDPTGAILSNGRATGTIRV